MRTPTTDAVIAGPSDKMSSTGIDEVPPCPARESHWCLWPNNVRTKLRVVAATPFFVG
jgi:hypothetical protein